jgi:hypothetical protein
MARMIAVFGKPHRAVGSEGKIEWMLARDSPENVRAHIIL